MHKQNMRNAVLAAVICILSVGCSSMNESGNSKFAMNVEYVNDDNEVISRPDLPQRVIVQFTVIPGAIWGRPLTDSQYLDVTDIGSALNADLSDLHAKIEPFATPLLDTEANEGLVITPKETKLARFGTFTYDFETQDSLGGTGFGSADPEIYGLVLTYFDRPAEIKAVKTENGDTSEFDIKVKKKGLVWLKITKLRKNFYLYTVHEFIGNEFLFIRPRTPDPKEAKQDLSA
ncbi:hypothetical protein [Grimontia sp. NTOU-MAR1]|uniref:hypothetical protein n=1 Tax=Grimontia sp. NTOU-MAR1 TaxID=3111011 RepID=UPI002DB9AA25|nr:hypothetical protein [Grimontia sp. NTOU-MAR1]WRV98039.1 hypothetical protein VP504_00980 [Grimontia sp. NTOU-MAR1]